MPTRKAHTEENQGWKPQHLTGRIRRKFKRCSGLHYALDEVPAHQGCPGNADYHCDGCWDQMPRYGSARRLINSRRFEWVDAHRCAGLNAATDLTSVMKNRSIIGSLRC